MVVTDTPSTGSERLRATLTACFARHDTDAAVAAALDAVGSGELDVAELYRAVLVPLLEDAGRRWHAGEMRVWEEHLETAALRTVIENVRPHVLAAREAVAAAHPGTSAPSVLLACPPEEWHVLAPRMLADRFEIEGWRSHYLGADVPMEDIVDAARELGVSLVVLSAATSYERVFLRDVLARLRSQLPGVRVLATGPAFACAHEDWTAEELLDPDAIPPAYA